jgi:hypothetical protein
VTAVSYNLLVQDWDEEAGAWAPPRAPIVAVDLRASIITDPDLKIGDCQRNALYGEVPCITGALPREVDYLLLVGGGGLSSHAFIDLTGPYDDITPRVIRNFEWRPLVMSDFAENQSHPPSLRYENVDAAAGAIYHFETRGNLPFSPGVSGSPLLIFVAHDTPAIFAAGIVVENYTGDHGENFNAVLVPEILSRISDRLAASFSPNVTLDDCASKSPPFSEPLLMGYLTESRKKLDDKAFNKVCACFERFSPWSVTRGVIKVTNEKSRDLLRISSPSTVSSSSQSNIGPVNLTSTQVDAVKSVLRSAQGENVRLLAVLQETSQQLNRACDQPEPCPQRNCDSSCSAIDPACVVNKANCEIAKNSEHILCEAARAAQLVQCEASRRARLQAVSDQIRRIENNTLTPQEKEGLKKSVLGRALILDSKKVTSKPN